MLKFKVCTKCKNEKPLSDFQLRPERKCGYYSRCKICKGEYQSKKHKNDRLENPIETWINSNFCNTRYRANKLILDFDLTKEYIRAQFEISKLCTYCSKNFNFQGTVLNRDDTPTLDRLIPTLGYTKDNVVLCCYRCNAIKNNATFEELRIIAGVLEKLIKSKNENRKD